MSHLKTSTMNTLENLDQDFKILMKSMKTAGKKIAPVWPLENFVAVNPYLGFTEKRFEQVAHELATAGDIQMTLPSSFYLKKIEEGSLKKEDILQVLKQRKSKLGYKEFIQSVEKNKDSDESMIYVSTVADLATQVTQKDWNRFVTSRISQWAASYFDKGQAIWIAADQKESIFKAWKTEAQFDKTPELSGLKDFRKIIQSFPDHPIQAAQKAIELLGIPVDQTSFYFHRLLLKQGGWAAHVARLDWDNQLAAGKDGMMEEFLAVLICWEAGLLKSLQGFEIMTLWEDLKDQWIGSEADLEVNKQLTENLILQEAFDLATQRKLIEKFKNIKGENKTKKEQPKAQAVFCIDVRSEVFRRNLELVDQSIETLGFAGFFGFPINYIPLGHQSGEAQCPVLLKTGPTIEEQLPDPETHEKAVKERILSHQLGNVWKSFKSGAVTCFSFVSPMGISYLPKIFTDSFRWTRPVPHPDKQGISSSILKGKTVQLEPHYHETDTAGIPLDQQIQMAKNALKAMSLTDDFGKFVLIVGHGSSTVNNPHATGYDCGACGGHTGEANAKVAAAVLNNREVRTGLLQENIFIPVQTIFLACLHDTTTDEVTIFNEQQVPSHRSQELEELKNSLKNAGKASRTERALRMSSQKNSSVEKMIFAKSKDWSETRPEWGLAGCSTFVVANREKTRNLDLEGKSFLHSYDWKKDQGFSILELIMTAPMVVTSWINLQYYGSTVDNKHHGSGNKTLHNVTSGLGVIEGFSGDLRVGLPFQAVHDGENYQHEPNRLQVIIHAPLEAINGVLEKHPSVKNLCDNEWIFLMAMDEEGHISDRYKGNLKWESLTQHVA
ncbi:YbcC family protein [Algoriphagus halophilus]|uniref:Probable inorganic carbon transporter subunit DabA n=1 Tax=Algoriphagus halophilus TaxID=226505 RepID=A0A1N6G585_9BACT|nr:DUF2309 domain-containing protein [Algoriphagus halophilus]SIO02611.1 hypothetical protein SAMN05444394_2974 [Algoriphagus halophilus]